MSICNVRNIHSYVTQDMKENRRVIQGQAFGVKSPSPGRGPPPQTISNGNADDNATVGIHGRANDDPNWKYPFDAQGGQTPPPPRLYA